jgi:hypothetical protein
MPERVCDANEVEHRNEYEQLVVKMSTKRDEIDVYVCTTGCKVKYTYAFH